MMKKSFRVILFILFLFLFIGNVSAKTLKQVKEELNRDIANRNSIINRQKNVQKNIKNAKGDIGDLEDEIAAYEKDIEETLAKIDELEEEIEEKQKEIEGLVGFLQKANADNMYLDYVFKAKSFTDFIYRNAVVEELTRHNDELIDELYNIIEENKKLKASLQEKIKKNEKNISNLESRLSNYNVSLKDLENAHSDVDSSIAERKKTVAYYEKVYKRNGCKQTMELDDCMLLKSSDGFVRPVNKGTISSEWGYRNCPIHGKELHNGIDIAVNMGTPVYAAADGTVVGITKKSSCGGNIVTIRHNIKGKTYRTRYLHLATINVKMGQDVKVTTQIGTSGGGGKTLYSNGGWDKCSTGAHLHFTILTGSSGSSSINPRSMVSFPSKGKSFKSRW